MLVLKDHIKLCQQLQAENERCQQQLQELMKKLQEIQEQVL